MRIRLAPLGILEGMAALAAWTLGLVLGRTALVAFGLALAGLLLADLGLAAARSGRYTLRVGARRVHEQDPVEVHVEAQHPGPGEQALVELSVGWDLEGDGSNVWVPHGSGKAEFAVSSRSRGPQRIGPLRVRRWGPLRAWAIEQDAAPAVEVEVLPRPEPVGDFVLRSRIPRPFQGRFQANRPGQGFDFFALRDYHAGDTMRSVNWKASARREEALIVNQRQLDTQAALTILLDARAVTGAGPAGQAPLDRGCRLALGLLRDAVASRDLVRFFAYGDGVTELPRGADKVAALETLLARLPAAGELPCAHAWQQVRRELSGRGLVIVITTAEFDATLADAVADMRSRGHGVTIASPTPNDGVAAAREQRLAARKELLDRLRNLGAATTDWKPGEPVVVEPAQASWRAA